LRILSSSIVDAKLRSLLQEAEESSGHADTPLARIFVLVSEELLGSSGTELLNFEKACSSFAGRGPGVNIDDWLQDIACLRLLFLNATVV